MSAVLSALPILIILGLVFFSVVRTMVLGLTLPPSLRNTDEPGVCGRCGYAFGMGHGEICPECGTRYVEAGVLTRPLVRKMRPPASNVLAAWVLLMLIVHGVMSAVIAELTSSASNRRVDAALLAIWIAPSVLWLIGLIVGVVVILRRRAKIFAPNWERRVNPAA